MLSKFQTPPVLYTSARKILGSPQEGLVEGCRSDITTVKTLVFIREKKSSRTWMDRKGVSLMRSMHKILLVLLITVTSTSLFGQSDAARLVGTITDASGAVLP